MAVMICGGSPVRTLPFAHMVAGISSGYEERALKHSAKLTRCTVSVYTPFLSFTSAERSGLWLVHLIEGG